MSAEVATCQHCHTLLVRDDDGRWIHTSLSYYCRDQWGVPLPTTAEPASWSTVYRTTGDPGRSSG